jgi:hypothetical protein
LTGDHAGTVANSTRRAAIADQNASPPNAAHAVRLALFLATVSASDTDETIETAAKIADNSALSFGFAVIVGVAAEYLLPFMGEVGLWNWPGAAVAIGVAGEIAFARRGSKLSGAVSDRLRVRLAGLTDDHSLATRRLAVAEETVTDALVRSAKLEKEAAEARQRTATFERQAQWRRIEPATSLLMSHALRKIPAACVRFIVCTGDWEGQYFASQLSGVFEQARWKTAVVFGEYAELPEYTIRIPSRGRFSDAEKEAIAYVQEAFRFGQLEFFGGHPPRMSVPLADLGEPQVDVHVGPKPPIEFEDAIE